MRVVVLDSGFCVLKGLIELQKKGVFVAAVIKKRRYWPKYVKGDDIKNEQESQPVGTQSRLPGILDGVPFDIITSNEPEFVMMFMSTYGTTNPKVGQEKVRRRLNGETIEYYHSEVVANHYKYRDAVDAHNSKRHDGGTHQGLSLERTWHTHHWPNRVFAFILGVCEVNAYLSAKHFRDYDQSQMDFRKNVAYAMIHNDLDANYEEVPGSLRRKTRSRHKHVRVTCKPYSMWTDQGWKKMFKTKYQQRVCATKHCNNKTRVYCSCSMGTLRCVECFHNHLSDPDFYK